LGGEPNHNVDNDKSGTATKFVGEIEGDKKGLNIVRIHNQICRGDRLEAIDPKKTISIKIEKIYNHKLEEVKVANGGHEKRYFLKFNKILKERTLLRKSV
jgi:hypothetical protein